MCQGCSPHAHVDQVVIDEQIERQVGETDHIDPPKTASFYEIEIYPEFAITPILHDRLVKMLEKAYNQTANAPIQVAKRSNLRGDYRQKYVAN